MNGVGVKVRSEVEVGKEMEDESEE